ncbi:hypothetical protein ACFLYO_03600 [Chloroflexota bacterium]
MNRKTHVTIRADQFYINGEPTYKGCFHNGQQIEGLLLNSRMVQGIFDDLNLTTRDRWAYPDTGRWDSERNTAEFIAAMPEWAAHGLLAFTINLQGGSPQGYSQKQPWINSAINPDGSLNPAYMARLERILDRADDLDMVAILGIFYFGQEKILSSAAEALIALDNATDWLLDRAYRNVLVEINNECNIKYQLPILKPDRVHELIQRVQDRARDRGDLPVSTSYGGGTIPGANVVQTADFLLLHGNGVADPPAIQKMVRQTRQATGYRPMPILFNEDDHFDFDKPMNNLSAALNEYASWGYFDYRFQGEYYTAGYQSVPVDWGINSQRKRGFFNAVKAITGGRE